MQFRSELHQDKYVQKNYIRSLVGSFSRKLGQSVTNTLKIQNQYFFYFFSVKTSLTSKLSNAQNLKLVGVVLNGLLCEMEE